MKVRIKFKKYGALRFIGHLDVMRFFQKAIRRSEIPIAFSEGYSPHMIMSFASPLGIGLTSEGEYFDIELKSPIESTEAAARLNAQMVEGMEVVSFRRISDEKKATGMAIVAAADYLIRIRKGALPDGWQKKITEFTAQPEIRIVKQTKRSEKEVDIKPLIYQMDARDRQIYILAASGSAENLKPDLVMEAFCCFLGIQKEEIESGALAFAYHRIELYADAGDSSCRKLVSLESLGTEITKQDPDIED